MEKEGKFKKETQELMRLIMSDEIAEIDLLRILKEVERNTAKICVEIIQDSADLLHSWEVFDGKPTKAEDFAKKTQRDILNTFLG